MLIGYLGVQPEDHCNRFKGRGYIIPMTRKLLMHVGPVTIDYDVLVLD